MNNVQQPIPTNQNSSLKEHVKGKSFFYRVFGLSGEDLDPLQFFYFSLCFPLYRSWEMTIATMPERISKS